MKKLLKEADISQSDCVVSSAGIFAVEEDEPSVEAVEVLERVYGVDGSRHRAQPMTEELSEENDCILTMDTDLKHILIEAYPSAKGKIFTLLEYAYGSDGFDGLLDIQDPYRGDGEDYERCAEMILNALKQILPQCGESA